MNVCKRVWGRQVDFEAGNGYLNSRLFVHESSSFKVNFFSQKVVLKCFSGILNGILRGKLQKRFAFLKNYLEDVLAAKNEF